MKDFCIAPKKPNESLIQIGEILGSTGINIDGLSLATVEGKSVIHFVVEDAIAAKQALESQGINIIKISEVYVLDKDHKRVTGKPGSFGGICKALCDNGIEIRFGYPAENNRFVFGVSDIEKARELLG
jgi:hypothetical protein